MGKSLFPTGKVGWTTEKTGRDSRTGSSSGSRSFYDDDRRSYAPSSSASSKGSGKGKGSYKGKARRVYAAIVEDEDEDDEE